MEKLEKSKKETGHYILNKEKIKILTPGDSTSLDSETLSFNLGTTLLYFILYSAFFLHLFYVIGFLTFKVNAMGLSIGQHIGMTWLLLLTKVSSIFEKFAMSYIIQISSLSSDDGWKLIYTWAFSLITGTLVSAYLAYISTPIKGGVTHKRGKILLEGKAAYEHCKKSFDNRSRKKNTSNLILDTEFFYNPDIVNPPFPKKQTITMPEDLRARHFIYVGGTGRGKSSLIKKHIALQNYRKQRDGAKIKQLIVDTPKMDYSKHFYKQHFYNISPVDEYSTIWDISKDLKDPLTANAFWTGKIPSGDNQEIWPKAAITVATGCTKLLQEIAPKEWNYGMLAYIMTKVPDELKLLLSPIYHQSIQILRSAPETISSVMFNLGSYTEDLIYLASIYDCFDSKIIIHQATAKTLKRKSYIEFNSRFMSHYYSQGDNLSGIEKKMREEERISAYCFHAVVKKINKEKPDWNWKDFANLLNKLTLNEIIELAIKIKDDSPDMFSPDLSSQYGMIPIDDMKAKSGHFRKMATTIMTYAREWDRAERSERLSIAEWLIDEDPKRKNLVLKPSETYPTLTEGLIKGILYFANSIILGGKIKDGKRTNYIILDELPTYGNIKDFLQPALALYRSKGWSCVLAFQDISQLTEIYDEPFVDFLMSNVANIFILGVNDGATAEKLSKILGEKSFTKAHINESRGETVSRSTDIQKHDEAVLNSNEVNLLGANQEDGKIYYLYIAAQSNVAYVLNTDMAIDYKERYLMNFAKWTDEGFLKLPLVKTKYNTKEVKDSDGQLSEIIDEEITNVDFTDIESIMKFGKENPSPFNKFVTEQKKLYRANPIIQPISEISLEEQDEVSDMVAKEVAVNALGGDALTIAKGLLESLQDNKGGDVEVNTNTMR